VKLFIKLAFLGAMIGCSGAANAALRCSIPAGVALNFGIYDDSSPTTTDVSTAFSVNCCSTTGFAFGNMTIQIGVSANSGQINTRQMKNGGNSELMSYQLYSTSYGGTIWGDGVIGGSAFTQFVFTAATCATGQSFAVSSAIFGRIFAQQAVSAGTYGDTLTITIVP
jgi:spore coat protein U-like protein